MKNPFAIKPEISQETPPSLQKLLRTHWIYAAIAASILLVLIVRILPGRTDRLPEWEVTWSGKISLMLIAEESFLLSPTGSVRGSITYNIGPFHLTRIFARHAPPARPAPPAPAAGNSSNATIDISRLYYSTRPPNAPTNTAHP